MAFYYYVFAVIALTTSASSLKCFQGSGTTGNATDCATGDRCVVITTAGTALSSCGAAAGAYTILLGASAVGCKTVATVKTCACKTDGCKPEDAKAGAGSFIRSYNIIKSAIPFFTMIVVSPMMKLLFV